jgi:DNA modification methylase
VQPYYQQGNVTLYCGDCRDVLPSLGAFSACVTDPPYGLKFMGEGWDHQVPGAEFWRLVDAPFLLAFGGTRTHHRMACAIEDAGWQIHDCLMWLYGQGFPKGKTCLKPAYEPIILARHGAPWLNIDGCRIDPDASSLRVRHNTGGGQIGWATGKHQNDSGGSPLGRWPANVLLDEDAAALLDEQSGELTITGFRTEASRSRWTDGASPLPGSGRTNAKLTEYPGDSGGASRFFYCAKASRSERNAGCEGLPQVIAPTAVEGHRGNPTAKSGERVYLPRGNHHPTVKPLALMRWLVRLVTPDGGTVLDPFCGSGSTLIAALREGRAAVGIELNERYCEIAAKRLQQEVLPLEATA